MATRGSEGEGQVGSPGVEPAVVGEGGHRQIQGDADQGDIGRLVAGHYRCRLELAAGADHVDALHAAQQISGGGDEAALGDSDADEQHGAVSRGRLQLHQGVPRRRRRSRQRVLHTGQRGHRTASRRALCGGVQRVVGRRGE